MPVNNILNTQNRRDRLLSRNDEKAILENAGWYYTNSYHKERESFALFYARQRPSSGKPTYPN